MRQPYCCLSIAGFARVTAAALAAVAGLGVTAFAQGTVEPAGQPPDSGTGGITGRDFGGLLLEMPTQAGGFTVTSRTAWTWIEDAPVSLSPTGQKQTAGAAVQRMYLRGDVRMQIGTRRLTAARAVVWAERVDDGTADDDQALYQIAVYFDRVSNPLGSSGAGASGDRLLLTARVRGALTLASDAPPRQGRPAFQPSDNLVGEGEQRLARYLSRLEEPGAAPVEPAERLPRPDPSFDLQRYTPSLNRPYEPGSPYGPNGPRAPITRLKRAPGLDAGGSSDQRLFSGRGVLTVAAGQPVLQTEGGENRIVVTGGVTLSYSEPARDRGLQLSAQNAVIFLAPGSLEDIARAPADKILGIYLEGDVVATDNKFTLRAPYVYYDFVANQAYTVDAVFWTWDERRGLPLYVRADSIRQTTRNSITAQGVTIAASAFYDPILSLGASSVTLSREPDGNGVQRVMIDGRNFAPALGGVPFFWVPGYSGDIERFPLKDVRFENSNDSGFGIKTRWDAFGLTGLRPPADWESLDVDILLDAWAERGLAIGADVRWNEEGNTGSLLAYGVPSDSGTDVLTSGLRRERDSDGRGLALYEQRIDLDGGWNLFLEASTVSDANFVDAYFEALAETRREFTTGADLRYTGENTLFSLQAKGNLDNFIANEYLIQSQGFTVRKLPEATYVRVADDLMAESQPGVLLWTHEYRVGRVGLEFNKPTARELGYDRATGAGRRSAFVSLGMSPDQSFDDLFTGAGLTDDTILRADTRQQIEWNLTAGPVRIQPYVIGRLTYYEDSFEEIAPDEQEENMRWWGGGGVRASTQAQRVYSAVESAALDVHGLRHIVEPSVSVFSAGTNRHNEFLPAYDYSVEGAEEGTAWRIGVNQTFQTQRGRPGAAGGTPRTVDLLKWNIDYVDGTRDTDQRGPIGRWFEYRPEESTFGNFVNTDAQLLLTDAFTIVGGATYDLDADQTSRASIGLVNSHGRDFRTFIELRRINSDVPLFNSADPDLPPGTPEQFLDSTYVTFGGDYRLSSLYTMNLSAAYDTDEHEFEDTALRINREFPDMTLTLRVRYNNITNETALGVIFTPLGRNRRMENTRRLGRDAYLEPLLGVPGPTDAAP